MLAFLVDGNDDPNHDPHDDSTWGDACYAICYGLAVLILSFWILKPMFIADRPGRPAPPRVPIVGMQP